MSLLAPNEQDQLRTWFGEMTGPVRLLFFTQTIGCEPCEQTKRILDGLPLKAQWPVEVRFTGPDDVWMSHGYGRESAYVAVQQFAGSPHEPYFRAFEAVCEPLGGRPHWGKLHYRDADSLRKAYPKFDDFLGVRDRLDPARVFTNGYLNRVLGV